jgi:hypothetical protein
MKGIPLVINVSSCDYVVFVTKCMIVVEFYQ